MENSYELMLLVKSDLDDSGEKKLFSRIDELISDKGKISKKTGIGKKALAYKIKKQAEGSYWVLDLEFESSAVSAFNQRLANEEDILRFLFLRKISGKKAKSGVKSAELPEQTEVKKVSRKFTGASEKKARKKSGKE